MREALATGAGAKEAMETMRRLGADAPRVAIVLEGTPPGLARSLSKCVPVPHEVSVPWAGDAAALLLGELAGVSVAVLERGAPEGAADPARSAWPVRVFRELGAEALIVGGRAVALSAEWTPGELAVLSDHINLLGGNPLVGPNVDEHGPRFPDLSEAYDPELRRLALRTAAQLSIPLREAVLLAARPGEGRSGIEAELGADVMGTFGVWEVITARHAGLRVLGLMIVERLAAPGSSGSGGTESTAAEGLLRLLTGVLRALAGDR
ncbi:MAG: purine-nucleoside phosphorylase [Gemmatimonadota bacterium]